MVTALAWSFLASVEISIFAAGSIREPSSLTCSPSTNTQPRSIHRSASRREHSPRSDITLDKRTPSGGGPFGVSGSLAAGGTAAAFFAHGFSRSTAGRARLRASRGPTDHLFCRQRDAHPTWHHPARRRRTPCRARLAITLEAGGGRAPFLRTARRRGSPPWPLEPACARLGCRAALLATSGAAAAVRPLPPVRRLAPAPRPWERAIARVTDSAGLRQRAQGSPWPSLP